MTPTQTKDVVAAVQGLWPRCKWTADEQDVFEERVRRLNIEPDQAEAAIRNLKATSDKFPQIAHLLKALENARNRPTVQADAPRPPTTRLTEMARRNGLHPSASPVEIVVAEWKAWGRASMKIRGECPTRYYKDFQGDMMSLARATERECDEWWYAIVESVQDVPKWPGMDRHAVERLRATAEGLARVEINKENAA